MESVSIGDREYRVEEVWNFAVMPFYIIIVSDPYYIDQVAGPYLSYNEALSDLHSAAYAHEQINDRPC